MTSIELSEMARIVSDKKRYLSSQAGETLQSISDQCFDLFDQVDALDSCLQQAIGELPHCSMLYVTDRHYHQVSSNVMADQVDVSYRGQDLSHRPYLQDTIPLKGLVLSNSYQDVKSPSHCISLVQAIHKESEFRGLLIADFNLDQLPAENDMNRIISNWRQFRGDPAIRGSLFSQQRNHSLMDQQIDRVHDIVRALMSQHGVFHFKLHYSSARVTLWLYDQPHHYRLHHIDDLLDETLFSQYEMQDWPQEACVDEWQLAAALDQFRQLRFADENIYLRSGSVNIINGMVGLNFSCDGSYYIPVQEFIDNSLAYWLGSMNQA